MPRGGKRDGAGRKRNNPQADKVIADRVREAAKRVEAGDLPRTMRPGLAFGIKEHFLQQLAKAGATGEKLSTRMAEGLDAVETRLLGSEGKFTDAKELADYKERREYVKMIGSIMGIVDSDAPIQTPEIKITIVNVADSDAPLKNG